MPSFETDQIMRNMYMELNKDSLEESVSDKNLNYCLSHGIISQEELREVIKNDNNPKRD